MDIPKRLKGTWWDEPISMEELEAITPLTADRTRAFELTPYEMVGLGLLFIGNDNTIILPPSASEGPSRRVVSVDGTSTANSNQVIRNLISALTAPSVTALGNSPSGSVLTAREAILRSVEITLIAGSASDVVLDPAVAGFFGVIQPCAVWSDTADVYTFTFQDEDNTPLVPTTCTDITVEIKGANEISPFAVTHGAAGDNSGSPSDCVTFHGQTDNKAIEVDVTGGGGVEELVLWFLNWQS